MLHEKLKVIFNEKQTFFIGKGEDGKKSWKASNFIRIDSQTGIIVIWLRVAMLPGKPGEPEKVENIIKLTDMESPIAQI